MRLGAAGKTLLLAAITVAGVACQPASPFFPRYEPIGPVPLARLNARLQVTDGCMWLVSEGERHLAIWPRNYNLVLRGVWSATADGAVLVRDGEEILVGGGEYRSGEMLGPARLPIEELIEGPIPAACDEGLYWLVSGIL